MSQSATMSDVRALPGLGTGQAHRGMPRRADPGWRLALRPLADTVERAKRDAGGDYFCFGGGTFAKALLQHDLVDELELFTNPGVAGFVTHDLSVVRQSADEVLVMQLGRAVERGLVDVVLDAPQHRNTQRLMASVPRPGGRPGPVGTG